MSFGLYLRTSTAPPKWPLGAVVGVMMWFYVSAFAVLVGAELNAELELQTTRDEGAGAGATSP